LEPAIKQINEHTDITVKVDQHKTGRSITGFSFKFKQKQLHKAVELNRDPNTADLFNKMTDAQRYMFSHKLSEMPEMAQYSQGTESFQQFAVRIADMLLQTAKIKELYSYLVKAGFHIKSSNNKKEPKKALFLAYSLIKKKTLEEAHQVQLL